MVDFGTVKSTVCPEPVVMDEHSVWVHTDVQEFTDPGMDGEGPIRGYQYHMIQYTKDEYILMLAAQNEKNSASVMEAFLPAQEDTDAMLVDHEYRLTLLEMGVTDDAV